MLLLSSFFTILYIVLAIFGILALGGMGDKDHDDKKTNFKEDDVDIIYHDLPDPKTNDTFNTYVGGAAFYCDKDDLRCFVGFVYFDPDDEAPRIYRNDMRMMGHIPRERLEQYLRWCHDKATYPCVGYVLKGNEAGKIASEVKIIKPYNRQYVDQEIKSYINWEIMKRGKEVNIRPEIYEPVLNEKVVLKHLRKNEV